MKGSCDSCIKWLYHSIRESHLLEYLEGMEIASRKQKKYPCSERCLEILLLLPSSDYYVPFLTLRDVRDSKECFFFRFSKAFTLIAGEESHCKKSKFWMFINCFQQHRNARRSKRQWYSYCISVHNTACQPVVIRESSPVASVK